MKLKSVCRFFARFEPATVRGIRYVCSIYDENIAGDDRTVRRIYVIADITSLLEKLKLLKERRNLSDGIEYETP